MAKYTIQYRIGNEDSHFIPVIDPAKKLIRMGAEVEHRAILTPGGHVVRFSSYEQASGALEQLRKLTPSYTYFLS